MQGGHETRVYQTNLISIERGDTCECFSMSNFRTSHLTLR